MKTDYGGLLGEIQTTKQSVINEFDQKLPALENAITKSFSQQINNSTSLIERALSQSFVAMGVDIQSSVNLQQQQLRAYEEQKHQLAAISSSISQLKEVIPWQDQGSFPHSTEYALSRYDINNQRQRTPIPSKPASPHCNCNQNAGTTIYHSWYRSYFQKESDVYVIHDRRCPLWYLSRKDTKYRVNVVIFQRFQVFGVLNFSRSPHSSFSGWSISQNLSYRPVVPDNSPAFAIVSKYFDTNPIAEHGRITMYTQLLQDLKEVFQTGQGSPKDTLEDGSNLIRVS
jgi:hypothetical protein